MLCISPIFIMDKGWYIVATVVDFVRNELLRIYLFYKADACSMTTMTKKIH